MNRSAGRCLRWSGGSRSGLTLLELILAGALLTGLLAAIYLLYAQCVDMRERSVAMQERTQQMRAILDRVAADVRRTTPYRLEAGGALTGSRMLLEFTTVAGVDRRLFSVAAAGGGPQRLAFSDIERMRYYLAWQENDDGSITVHGLYREISRDPAAVGPVRSVSPQTGGLVGVQAAEVFDGSLDSGSRFGVGGADVTTSRTEVVSRDIKYFRVDYSDGHRWHEEWDPSKDPLAALRGQADAQASFVGGGIPLSVRITIGFEQDDDYIREAAGLVEQQGDLSSLSTIPGFVMDPLSTSSLDDQGTVHPDRYVIVVPLPAADRIFSPLFSKLSEAANKFGGTGIQDFMSQGSNFGETGGSPRGGGGGGGVGGTQGPGGLFDGR